MRRSVLLKGESYNYFLDKLVKLPEPERKKEVWRRMQVNGMTYDSEKAFRKNCEVIHYRLPKD